MLYLHPTRQQISPAARGRVYIVGAGPGDPELITLKGARLLGAADVILYDRLANPALLEMAPAEARRIFVGKRCGKASILQDDINRILVEEALRGHQVVRLKGGDPFVFGRGGEEGLELVRHGIEFEVVPGITSAVGVPAYAGIPLTQRNQATSFTVMSGHLHRDSDPHDWGLLAAVPTLVVLMGLRNLPLIAERLLDAGKPGDTPAAVIRQGTTDRQESVTGTLATLSREAAGLEPPAVIVIGEVVALHEHLRWFPEGGTGPPRSKGVRPAPATVGT